MILKLNFIFELCIFLEDLLLQSWMYSNPPFFNMWDQIKTFNLPFKPQLHN